MKSTKKIRFQKTKKQTIKKRSNRNKKVKRRRTRKRNKIYGGKNNGNMNNNNNNGNMNKTAKNNTASYNFTVLDDKGNNLLHLAVISNDADEVKEIIDIINSEDGDEYTVKIDDSDDIINIKNNDGNTPLHLAIQTNNKEIIESLLNNYADINRQNNDGNTPLHLAILNGFKKVGEEKKKYYNNTVKHIIKSSNVDINKIDNEGNTPLHLAIIQYEKDIDNLEEKDYVFYNKIIKSFLNNESFKIKPNNKKNSPLHLLVNMLKNRLSMINQRENITFQKKNLEIYNLIIFLVEFLVDKKFKNEDEKEELFDIFKMKNEKGETAYDILQSSPTLPEKYPFFPSNYKSLITIDPKFQQNKKTQIQQRNVQSGDKRRSKSKVDQVYPIRNSKQKETPPFRQTLLTSKPY